MLTPEESAIIEEETLLLAKVQGALVLQAIPEEQTNYYSDIIELRDSITDSRAEDIPAIIAHMERLILLAQQQERIAANSQINCFSPYFAHIRLDELNRKRDILIGNHHYTSDHLDFPIIDWKHAPISKIYYRYQEGDEYAEEFGDRNIEGTVLVRRTVSIENGKLMRIDAGPHRLIYTENGWKSQKSSQSHLIGGSGKAFRPSKPVETNTGSGFNIYRKDKFLQEITALIDPDQFEIIIRPETGVVVIQGGAGSGKTTIALHRLAYLVSLKPHYFVPSQIIAVVFNQALSKYISKILPTLGASHTKSWVYQKWARSFRSRYFSQLPNRSSEQTPVSVIEIKRHPAMLKWLEDEVKFQENSFYLRLQKELHQLPEQDTVIHAWNALENWPLARRILILKGWGEGKDSIPRIPPCNNYILSTRLQHLIEDAFPELASSPTSLAVTIWEDCFIHEKKLRDALNHYAPETFSDTQIQETWKWAVKNYESRHQTTPSVDEEKGSIIQLESQIQELDEEDDTLLLLLYNLTLGPFRKKKNKKVVYPHILVDEAQDFSPVELQLLMNHTPEKRPSITLAGDFDQQIVEGSQLNNWIEMFEHLGLDNTVISPLKIGYRSTHEIMEIAKAIIGPYSVNQEWKAVRHGAPVELFKFQSHGTLISFLSEALIELVIQEPSSNVAILARYPAQADLIYNGLLKADVPCVQRVNDQDFSFEPGIEVSDIFQVKGLEFDYVILVDVDEQTFPDDQKARHLLYVGVTRAAHQLWLMTCRKPSPLLPLELLKEGN